MHLTPSTFLALVLILMDSTDSLTTGMSLSGLKCYSDLPGLKWTKCEERKGFRTCFTKYNEEGAVTARGCSTKDKIFHVECENHVMGAKSEKFCYCSYPLCNKTNRTSSPSYVLIVCATAMFYFGRRT